MRIYKIFTSLILRSMKGRTLMFLSKKVLPKTNHSLHPKVKVMV